MADKKSSGDEQKPSAVEETIALEPEEQKPEEVVEAHEEPLRVEASGEETPTNKPPQNKAPKRGFKQLLQWRPTKKQSIIIGSVAGLLLVLGLIPVTRNVVYGQVFKTKLSVDIYDEIQVEEDSDQTAKVNLTNLTIRIDGKNVKDTLVFTSPHTFTGLKPGKHTVEVSAANYKTFTKTLTLNLGLGKQNNRLSTKLEVTGIPTKIRVKNVITDEGAKGVTLSYKDSKTTTDDYGNAILTLPKEDDKIYEVKLSGDGFISRDNTINLRTADKYKTVDATVVPSGKVYFLSKQSGKVDVVKTNLDGSDREVILAGTGSENDRTITMISTPDWRYLALNTKREANKSQLILIDTSDDSQTTMDEGDANFTLLGWDTNKLVYQTDSNSIQYYQTGKYKLKSFDAQAKKLNVFYQTSAEGTANSYSSELFSNVQIVNHRLLYSVTRSPSSAGGYTVDTFSSNIGSGEKKKLHSYTEGYLTLTYASVDEAYYTYTSYASGESKTTYFEVDRDGNWKTEDKPNSTEQYTYFISPKGDRLLWSEPRDGKQTILLGNAEAKDTKKLYDLSELKPYAWLTDGYALYSKDDSELYIASLKENAKPLKISDYHRPADVVFRGYGGGGGGPY